MCKETIRLTSNVQFKFYIGHLNYDDNNDRLKRMLIQRCVHLYRIVNSELINNFYFIFLLLTGRKDLRR